MLTLNRKFFITLFFVIALFGFAFNSSSAIVRQTSEFYVNDSANIIDSNLEDYIIKMNKQLYSKTGAQIVVVSVNSLEGMSVEDYAVELFRSYGIGSKEKNNGVLLLVSTGERKARVEVGYGLEGRITDGKAGRILSNYIVPYLKNDNWNDGIENGFNAILAEVCEEYNVTIDGSNLATNLESESEESDVIYLSGFIVFLVCLILRHALKRHPLTKYLSALGVVLVATIANMIIDGSPDFFTYFFINLFAAIIGLLGIYALLIGGSSGRGGSSGGGSFGGGGSSGGGGASSSF